MACPIWPGHTAERTLAPSASGGYRTASIVSCPTCGGFEISTLAESGLKAAQDEDRWRLSWATRHASEAGAPLVLLTADLRRTVESVAEPRSPVGKADLLLRLLASRARVLGQRALFDPKTDWPLAYARGERELVLLLTSLKKRGFVDYTLNPAEGVELTFEGWERVESLEAAPRSKSTKAFVAMWFDVSMDPVYDDGIFATLHGLGYDAVRVDREHFLGKIDDYIVKSIRESAIVVADFTGHRHGVYWEAGFGLGLGLPVIYSCRDDEIANAHFDTRQYNHIVWRDPADLGRRLRERILATITDRPRPRS